GIILEIDQGEKILKNKFFYNSKEGIKQQIDLDFILREMSQDILNEIYNYPLDSAKVILAGGGSYMFNDYINSNIKGVFQIEKGEFANSFGYKKIGQIYFKEK
ncbi:MAG: hypothetical protein LIR50_14995, partial [Bacillota bacterium]|nr:hypothetical protein [Bacillota bacterium]